MFVWSQKALLRRSDARFDHGRHTTTRNSGVGHAHSGTDWSINCSPVCTTACQTSNSECYTHPQSLHNYRVTSGSLSTLFGNHDRVAAATTLLVSPLLQSGHYESFDERLRRVQSCCQKKPDCPHIEKLAIDITPSVVFDHLCKSNLENGAFAWTKVVSQFASDHGFKSFERTAFLSFASAERECCQGAPNSQRKATATAASRTAEGSFYIGASSVHTAIFV